MLTNEELLEIQGGVSWSLAATLSSILIFLIGVVDGQIKLK